MKEALRLIENFQAQQLGILAIGWMLAFSKKQRDWIKERDGDTCVAPFKHNCDPSHQEVHHILPQRYLTQMGVDPDYPENGIDLCKNAHNVVHPDRVEALRNYHEEKKKGGNSFNDMFQERQEKLKNREIYWNDEHDRPMQVVATRNTQRFNLLGKLFPKK
jgi:hypothetical protein